MKNIKQILVALVNDESGQDLIEYALVAGVIALGSVAALSPLATAISGAFGKVSTSITTNV